MFGINEALISFFRRQVGLRTDVANANGSLHAKAKNINDKLTADLDKKVSQSGIKSVQRGVLSSQTITSASVDVTISPVDVSKSFVIIATLITSTDLIDPNNKKYHRNLYVCLTNPTNLRFSNNSHDSWYREMGSVAWEVVEFY